MATAPGLRVGDAEREATAASLREHFTQGRLTFDEFNQRLDAAFAAKTDLDLARITSDLPHIAGYPLPWPAPQPRVSSLRAGQDHRHQDYRHQDFGQRPPRRPSVLAGLAGLVMIVLLIIVVSGLFAPFALFGLTVSRPLLIVLAIITFGRRILRRLMRGGSPIRSRGRHWRV